MNTLGAILVGAALVAAAPPASRRDVDTRFPYTGPAIPVGDWVDPTVKGNGKGFPRLVEAPAVKPATSNPTNNINVIALSYVPSGINIHFQTPFGLDSAPTIHWGSQQDSLKNTVTGQSKTYGRTPPCSLAIAVQCSEHFHDVQITGLKPNTRYYYSIQASNGTTASDTLSFHTSKAAGDHSEFTIAVLNDMGYTNAHGTYKYLNQAVEDGLAFAWHGGDISYADDWYSGILPCEDSWEVCYSGESTRLPGGPPYPAEYVDAPLPAGEVPDQGGPQGGDMSVIYESNWDLWQQWMNTISSKVPYMVLPGNHEAACAEFDGPGNILTAYLNDDKSNSSVPGKSGLNYYSCPPSQRNFTAFQNRFRMPGSESGGVGNMWYSFDYGLAHFVSLDTETDFAYSPEWPFVRDATKNETLPTEAQTFITDSGPFGRIDGNNWKDNKAYEQYQWLAKDLAAVDRTKTPWIFVNSHRPMYSTETASYQANVRNAFEQLMLDNGVDAYFSGHIHYYERLFPLGRNGTIDTASILDNNTYYTNEGKSMTHIINGMAGNIESHSTLDAGEALKNITAVLDDKHYGFSKLKITQTKATWSFIKGADGTVGDELTLLKQKH